MGGELVASAIYTAESAPPALRATFGSSVFLGIIGGICMGSACCRAIAAAFACVAPYCAAGTPSPPSRSLPPRPSSSTGASLDCRFCRVRRRLAGLLLGGAARSTSRTSHLTPHTSHLTPHTSHLTPHTSHLTPHTSHVARHTSHVTRHTSHVTRHTRCRDDGWLHGHCRSACGERKPALQTAQQLVQAADA